MQNNLTPLFKWAGGKKKMLKKYDQHFEGLEFNDFVDLFGGGAMMSLWVHKNFPKAKITLNEYNPAIFSIYEAIKSDFEKFKKMCVKLESEYLALPRGKINKKELGDYTDYNSDKYDTRSAFYFRIRDLYNGTILDSKDTLFAATSYFLLKTCFNGIWQGSEKTFFSTPHGNGSEQSLFDWDNVLEFKEMLDKAELFNEDFRKVPLPAEAFVYADPPYVASYTNYSNSFGEKETKDLVEILLGCSQFGFSNKSHSMFDEKFANENIITFSGIKYTASRKDTENATSDEILVLRRF